MATTVSVTTATKTRPSACEMFSSGIPVPHGKVLTVRALRRGRYLRLNLIHPYRRISAEFMASGGRRFIRTTANNHTRRPTRSKMPPICGNSASSTSRSIAKSLLVGCSTPRLTQATTRIAASV